MSCPPKSMLVRYEHGHLEESDGVALDRHVAQCSDCLSSLAELRLQDEERRFFRRILGDFETAGAQKDTPPLPSNEGREPVTASWNSGKETSLDDSLSDTSTWVIPDYERIALCGEGSYGSVWAVRDRVGVYRALKLIDLDRLERAGVTCYELHALETYCRKVPQHPHLITVFHVGAAGRWLYYTMELADDQAGFGAVSDPFPQNYRPLTLATLIKAGRLKIDPAIEIARRLLRGLTKLHELDLLHRDVKPSNIVFVNRQPKLADIGILTGNQDSAKVIGTPKYMPPDRAIDKTADVFAMGVLLREMIESVPAAPVNELAEPTRWDMEKINTVIERACASQGTDRYVDALDMLNELETCRFDGSILFEELASPPRTNAKTPTVAVQLVFAFIHRIPWIMGGIIVLYLISRWT